MPRTFITTAGCERCNRPFTFASPHIPRGEDATNAMRIQLYTHCQQLCTPDKRGGKPVVMSQFVIASTTPTEGLAVKRCPQGCHNLADLPPHAVVVDFGGSLPACGIVAQVHDASRTFVRSIDTRGPMTPDDMHAVKVQALQLAGQGRCANPKEVYLRVKIK